jgi:hypothetical protein
VVPLGEVGKLGEHDSHVLILVGVEGEIDRGQNRVDDHQTGRRLLDLLLEAGDVTRQENRAAQVGRNCELEQTAEVGARRFRSWAQNLLDRVLVGDDDHGRRPTAVQLPSGHLRGHSHQPGGLPQPALAGREGASSQRNHTRH